LTFFIQWTISLWSFLFSYYFSSYFIYFHFDFVPIIISSTSSNWVFCIYAVTSLINSSFTFFPTLFTNIPFLYFTFYSLLTLLNVEYNFGPHWKMVWFYFSIWLYILLSDDCQVTLWMSLCWHKFPITVKSLPTEKLPFVFHCHLFCCEGYDFHMLDINRTLFLQPSIEVP
jgi:hypothetical protein